METKRLIGLDLLRLLAIVLVLGAHFEARPADLNLPIIEAWQQNGTLGVDLFFVLSGFLVSGLLFSEYRKRGKLSLSRFYIRRAWRIYPPFYALILFTYFYCETIVDYKIPTQSLLSELFFVQCYIPAAWNHTWTLAVEEHFYIAMPLLLLLLTRISPNAVDPFRRIPQLVGVTCVAVVLIRLTNCLIRDEYTNHTHAFNTHLRIDALFFGVAIAYVYHFHASDFRRLVPWRYVLMAAGLLLLVITQAWPGGEVYRYTSVFTQRYLGCASIMVGILLCELPSNRITRPLAAIGTYSYSIYLWHMSLIYWVMPHLPFSWTARTTIYLIGAIALGVIMSRAIELPLLKLRDSLFPSTDSASGLLAIKNASNGQSLSAARAKTAVQSQSDNKRVA